MPELPSAEDLLVQLAAHAAFQHGLWLHLVQYLDFSRLLSRPLDEGQLYRFRLIGPTGALGGTWAYQTQSPLEIVTTLPGDRSIDVPIDTGIEVTFDQDGVADIAGHFRIQPEVPGRFELHQFRTWVFVPEQQLQPSTAYRVTVSPGIGMTGSDQVLEHAYDLLLGQIMVARQSVGELAQSDGLHLRGGCGRVGSHWQSPSGNDESSA